MLRFYTEAAGKGPMPDGVNPHASEADTASRAMKKVELLVRNARKNLMPLST